MGTSSSPQPGSSGTAAEGGASPTAPPATQSPAAAPPAAAAPAPRRRLRLIAAGVIVTGLISISVWYWLTAGFEKTDNAQIDADIVPIRAQTGGIIAKVLFQDNQVVEAGAVLIEIQRTPYELAVAEAEAHLSEATATLAAEEAEVQQLEKTNPGDRAAAEAAFMQSRAAVAVVDAAVKEAKARHSEARRELTRAEELFASKATTQVNLEKAQSNLELTESVLRGVESQRVQALARQREMQSNRDRTSGLEPRLAVAKAKVAAARARIAAAETARDTANLNLSYTKVVAPVRGIASRRVVSAGQLLTAGQPIVTLVQSDKLWVTANFKETQVGRMKLGDRVEISVDAYDGARIVGEVESISAATGSRFSLLPPDNATGNFTKVVQRVPVRIRITSAAENLVLRPGMSVEVKVAVKAQSATVSTPRAAN